MLDATKAFVTISKTVR